MEYSNDFIQAYHKKMEKQEEEYEKVCAFYVTMGAISHVEYPDEGTRKIVGTLGDLSRLQVVVIMQECMERLELVLPDLRKERRGGDTLYYYPAGYLSSFRDALRKQIRNYLGLPS